MQTVATIVLVFDFFLVAIVEGYLIIIKRRFAKKGWLKEPGYLYVHQSPCFAQLIFLNTFKRIPLWMLATTRAIFLIVHFNALMNMRKSTGFIVIGGRGAAYSYETTR
jgi:hypothetical protein